MADALKVLILEDVATDAELAVAQLKRSGLRVTAMRVDTEQEFVQALGDFEPNLIVSDFSLPSHFDGLSALELARRWSPQVPFVFLSGTIGEERAVEAMRRGATDYVLKDRLDRLVPVVTRAMQEAGERNARRKAEEELAATKGRLDSILSSLVDVVWSLSLKPYQLLYVNAAAEAIYQRGLSDPHPDPRLWFELVHCEDRERVSQHWDQALQGNAFDIEYRIVHSDGGLRWIHDRAQPVRDDSGALVRLDGLAQDVTQRKLQEDRIARLSRIRDVLSGINAAIVRTTDKQALFREACRIAVEHGKFRTAWIGLAVPGQAEVEPVAFIGHDGTSLEELDASMVASLADTGATCRALSGGGRVVLNDIPADAPPSIKAQALAHGYRSLVVLSLVVDEETIGAVTLCAAEAHFFDQEEMRLLSELAADISFAYAYRTKEEQLNYLAYYDVLTGLANRSFLHVRLAGAVTSGQRHNQGLTALVLNLDNLKTINDSLGHTAGDALLKIAGARITESVRQDDIVARYGGDEFVVVLSHQGRPEDASHTMQRLLSAIAQPIRIDDRDLYVTCSVGASVFPQDGADPETLLRNAFAAMHRAKELGGNGAQFFEPEINARVTKRLGLDALLRRALERSEFTLNFQPKVSLLDGEVTGVEALLRWSHPDLGGPVSPVTFIPILEDNGLIGEVGEWVLRQACAQIGAWEKAAVRPVPIAVNLSARQLQQPELDRTVKRILDECRVQPGMLELEITETVLMKNPEQVIGILRSLQSMGIRLSVDDFGTGYSSLSYLRSFPLDTLKIDRSFIGDVATNPDDGLIAKAVISMAHSLRLKVVAEGVETAAQLAFLAASGCDEIQGYYFARPMDAEACTQLLRERGRLDVAALKARGDKPTLLLVDDEENILSALKRTLRNDGYRILTANSATEAFELLAGNSVGVVVSDQRMPGMTGVEFLSRVKDLYPDTIRIVLSGYTDLQTVTDAINRGAVYKFFSKPWDDKELRLHVQAAFALRTLPAESMQSGRPTRSPAPA